MLKVSCPKSVSDPGSPFYAQGNAATIGEIRGPCGIAKEHWHPIHGDNSFGFDPCNPCKSVAKKFVSAPVISVTTLSTFVACQAIFFQPLSTHSPARKSTCARPDPYWPRIVKIEIRVLNSRPCRSIFRHLSHPAKPLFRKILRISSLLARFYAEWPGSKDSNRHQIMDLAKSIRKKHVALSMCGGRL
jgi:hypothetical protein